MKIEISDENICTECLSYINKLCDDISLSKQEISLLKKPKKVITFTIPIKMDSGKVEFFNAYRVQYNNVLGPTIS